MVHEGVAIVKHLLRYSGTFVYTGKERRIITCRPETRAAVERGRGVKRMPRGKSGIYAPYLRHWRIIRALDQTELAQKAGVGRMTVVRAEKGESISAPTLRALATALDTTPERLMKEDPFTAPESKGAA